MRILHINGNYITTALHQTMIEHLDKYKIESTVVVPNNGVDQPIIKTNENVMVLNCFHQIDRYLFHYKQKKIIDAIERSTAICDVDIIHAYTLFTDGYSAMRLAEKYNKPFVVAIRNTDINVFMKYMFWLRSTGLSILKKASCILFLSNTYLTIMQNNYLPQSLRRIIRDKSVIIPNGIDDFWFENRGTIKTLEKDRASNNRVKLVYAGRIDKNKNIAVSAEAVNILNQQGFEASLDIAGKIIDEHEYAKISNNKSVTYHGMINREQLLQLYRSNDIFLMPSHTETFGLVYVEAMSQGLPVLYTKGQGFDGQFEEGVVGFSVNPKDPYDIAKKAVEIISNYSNMSKQAIKGIDVYNWDSIAHRYANLYGNIIRSEEKGIEKK